MEALETQFLRDPLQTTRAAFMENAELNFKIPTDVISICRSLYRHVEPYDCHVVLSSLMDTSIMIDHDKNYSAIDNSHQHPATSHFTFFSRGWL